MILRDINCNILFLGGAKRVSMAKRFIESAQRLKARSHIYSYELSEEVPVALLATVIKGRRWSDPSLMEHLIETVVRNDIRIVVPFVDDAVAIAAHLRDENPSLGISVPTGSEFIADAMFDKLTADSLLRDAGIPLPERFCDVSINTPFPIIAKPRRGSASKGIVVCKSFEDWQKAALNPNDYLIQPYFADRHEFTIDCYVDKAGDVQAVSPRRRLEVLGGEVIDTITVDDPALIGIARNVLAELPLRGAVTIQVLRAFDKSGSFTDYLMEINPRLGGGVICSIDAGCNIPDLILAEALDLDDVKPTVAESEVRLVRFMSDSIFKHSKLY